MPSQIHSVRAILLTTAMAILFSSYGFSEVPYGEESSEKALDATEDFPPLPLSESLSPKPRVEQLAKSMAQWKSEVPPLDLTDKRSALAQVTAMSLDLELAERLLRETERQDIAAKIAGRREMFNRIFRAEAGIPKHSYPAVHMVGLYSPGKSHPPVHVRLTDHSGPFMLVLTAYETVDWVIENAEDVDLRYVIVSGYYTQRITGIPADVPVFNSSYELREGPYFYATERDDNFTTVCKKLEELTGGLQVTTFLGRYNTGLHGFDIGPENAEWRTQYLAGLMRQTHAQAVNLVRSEDLQQQQDPRYFRNTK